MGRKAKLTDNQVKDIRNSTGTQRNLASEFKVSLLTVWKVKNYKEAYAVKVEGTPVLNAHGEEVDFIPQESTN